MRDILGSPCDTGSGALGTGSCSLMLKPKKQETHKSFKQNSAVLLKNLIFRLYTANKSFPKIFLTFVSFNYTDICIIKIILKETDPILFNHT